MASKSTASRLKVRQGKLSLSYPTLPDLGCLLSELDENGCRATIMFQYVPPEMAASWRRILSPKRPVHVRLEVHPWLPFFEADGLVVQSFELPAQTDIELAFNQLPPEQRMRLHHAVMAMAMQKFRKDSQAGAAVPVAVPVTRGEDGQMRPAPPPEMPQVPPAEPVPPAAPEGAIEAAAAAFFKTNSLEPLPSPVPLQPFAPPAVMQPEVMRSAVTRPSHAAGAGVTDTSTLLKLKKIGEVLLHMGQLKPEQLEQALAEARKSGEKIGRYLVKSGLVPADVLCRALALQSGLPVTDLAEAQVPEKLAKAFGYPLMARHSFVPFDEAGTFVCVAVSSPLKSAIVQELERSCGKKVEVFLAQEEWVLKLLDGLQLKQQKKLRKHIRYDIALPLAYQFVSRLGTPAEPVSHSAMSVNISEGGMLIEGTPSALGKPEDLRRRGMCVRVTFGTPGSEIRAICQLRAIREKERKAAEDPRWLLGVEFVEITVDHRRKLKEICLKAVARGPAPGRKPFVE